MTLRLHCVRCGDWDDMDPTTLEGWGLCSRCHIDGETVFYHHPAWEFSRWLRWQRDWTHHPTFIALTAALEAMESVPPGSLVEES